MSYLDDPESCVVAILNDGTIVRRDRRDPVDEAGELRLTRALSRFDELGAIACELDPPSVCGWAAWTETAEDIAWNEPADLGEVD